MSNFSIHKKYRNSRKIKKISTNAQARKKEEKRVIRWGIVVMSMWMYACRVLHKIKKATCENIKKVTILPALTTPTWFFSPFAIVRRANTNKKKKSMTLLNEFVYDILCITHINNANHAEPFALCRAMFSFHSTALVYNSWVYYEFFKSIIKCQRINI